MSDDGLRDLQEAAEWLGVSWETLRKKVSARQVPFTKIFGTQVRFTQEHLDEIVAAGQQPVATAPSRAQVVAIRAAQNDPPKTEPPKNPPAGPRTPPPPSGPRRTEGAVGRQPHGTTEKQAAA